MPPVIFRCPALMFGLLVAGALAPLGLIPLGSTENWPPVIRLAILAAQLGLLLYALMLVPTKLVISDEGIRQKLLFRECRVRWEDIVEWRHCDGGQEYEEPQLRETTLGKWHMIEFWIQDKTGRKHHVKKWLVFGKRSKQLADIMRAKGIKGG